MTQTASNDNLYFMDIKTLWEKYYKALKQQDWSKALEVLSAIKGKRKQDSQVYLKTGDLLQRMGNTMGAVEAYHKAAIYLVKEGFVQKAAAIFKIILRLDPKNSEASIKLQRVIEVASSEKGAFSRFASSTLAELPPDSGTVPSYSGPVGKKDYKEAPSYNEISVPGEVMEVEKPEIPSYGEITLPGSEIGPSEIVEKQRELGPGYGEVTLEEEDIAEDVTGLWTPEKTGLKKEEEQAFESYEDFDDLLSEAAKELPNIFKGTRRSTSLSAILMSVVEGQAAEFAGRAEKRIYKSGGRIIKEGDTGDSLFFIKEGTAKVVAHILGKEFVLATLGNGDVFGEVTFLTGRPRTASVVADGDIEILEFKRALLEETISKHPEVLEGLNDLYDSRVSNTLKKIGSG